MKRVAKIFCIIIILCFCLNMGSCSAKDSIIIQCNGIDITKSVFVMRMTQESLDIYDEEGEVAQAELIKRAKENTLEYLKEYSYYKQQIKDNNYKLDEKESGQFKAAILESLIGAGFPYDPSDKDKAFLEQFGVTFEEYMTYKTDEELFELIRKNKLGKMEITEGEIKEYFDSNRVEYASGNAEIILLKGEIDNKQEVIGNMMSDLSEDKSILEIKGNYSEYIEKSAFVMVEKTSNVVDIFGENVIEKVLESSIGDVNEIENNKGTVITFTTNITGLEENTEIIKEKLGNIKYKEFMDEELKSDKYEVVIKEQKLYDSIDNIPVM